MLKIDFQNIPRSQLFAENVAIYAFLRVKLKKNVGNLTDVKHLTNSMSEKALYALVKLIYFHHYLFYFERIAGVLRVACSNHGKIGNILSFFADLRDLSS